MNTPYENTPDARHRFWLYSPEGDGFMFFATATERDDYAKTEIRTYCDFADGGWYEEIDGIIAGVVTHTIKRIVKDVKPVDYADMDQDQRDESWPYGDEFDEIVDYTLEPLVVP